MKHQFKNNALCVAVDGDILSTTADGIRAGFVEMMNQDVVKRAGWSRFELDLTRSKIIDSAGLNLVVAMVKAAKARGASVVARVASRTVHRTFIFTRLDQQIEVVMEAA